MTTPWSQEYAWAFYTAACILWLIAGVGLFVALFRDRSRGRRRCPKCWYDMAGVPGLKCPECGREARKERRLHTTRRRWRLATLFALLAALGIASFRGPHTFRHGFFAAVPIPILNFVLSWFPEDAEVAYKWCRTRMLWSPTGRPPPWPTITDWDELLASWYAAQTMDGSDEDDMRIAVVANLGLNGRPAIPNMTEVPRAHTGTVILWLGSLAFEEVREARGALEQLALDHRDAWTRGRALAVLCEQVRGQHSQHKFLRSCIHRSTDAFIREHAAIELAQFNMLSEQEVVSLLRGNDASTRSGLVRGFAQSSSDRAWVMPEMLRIVRSDPDSSLSCVILDQLAGSTPLEQDWGDVLLSLLRRRTVAAEGSSSVTGNEYFLVVAAIKASASLREPRLPSPLADVITQLHEDPKSEIATHAWMITLRRPESFSTQALSKAWDAITRQDPHAAPALTRNWDTATLQRFIDTQHGKLRDVAIARTLEQSSSDPASAGIALAWLANDPDPVLRSLSASSLGQSKNPDRAITLALIEAARRDESSAVRAVALRAAESRRDADTQLVAALIDALKDPSPQVVLAAANSLARLGPRAAAAHDALTAAADHPDASARSAIADAITKTRAN